MSNDLIKTFQTKNIGVILVKTAQDACDKILEMIPEGTSVGYGGSVTLDEIGIIEKLRQGNYQLFDKQRVRDKIESNELGHRALNADFFLSSANAITRDGKIVNKDKTGNRVAAIAYGPKKVILIVGKNKIVNNLDEAFARIKKIAPKNAQRLNLKTPCVAIGKCTDCNSPDRICCVTTIIERQPDPDRMKIILVDEELGF